MSEKYDLYIVHGWTYSVKPWQKTLEELEGAGLRVKMLNVPGLTTDSRQVFTIDDYVKWADQEIPDGAVALGHSNGGRILLNLAARKPDKLSRLILLNSAGVYEDTLKKRIVKTAAKLGRPLKKIPLVDKTFHRITGTTDYERAPENMKKTLANMLASDQQLALANVTTDTKMIWGRQDRITPPRQAAKIYESLPHSDIKYYEGWGHAPYISDPEGLAGAIIAAMREAK